MQARIAAVTISPFSQSGRCAKILRTRLCSLRPVMVMPVASTPTPGAYRLDAAKNQRIGVVHPFLFGKVLYYAAIARQLAIGPAHKRRHPHQWVKPVRYAAHQPQQAKPVILALIVAQLMCQHMDSLLRRGRQWQGYIGTDYPNPGKRLEADRQTRRE